MVLFLLAHSHRSIPSGQTDRAIAEENLPSSARSMSSRLPVFMEELLAEKVRLGNWIKRTDCVLLYQMMHRN